MPEKFTESKIDFAGMKQHILGRLRNELPAGLFYHGLHHVEDVHAAVITIATHEHVEGIELLLLETAALYHDSGFIHAAHLHEQTGCEIARVSLPQFGYTPDQIERICGMIMATRIPQSPLDKLQEILCDADLDYLGRADYDEIAQTLFEEMNTRKLMAQQEWLQLQIDFLAQHHFFTTWSQANRNAGKEARLQLLKSKINT
jgi:uncharacterized protein